MGAGVHHLDLICAAGITLHTRLWLVIQPLAVPVPPGLDSSDTGLFANRALGCEASPHDANAVHCHDVVGVSRQVCPCCRQVGRVTLPHPSTAPAKGTAAQESVCREHASDGCRHCRVTGPVPYLHDRLGRAMVGVFGPSVHGGVCSKEGARKPVAQEKRNAG